MPHKTRGTKTTYASDVTDEEWSFCAPYLTLMKEDAPQRAYPMRALFNAARDMVRAGCPWRMIPNDLPPWHTVHQQARRWIKAGCFEAMARTTCASGCESARKSRRSLRRSFSMGGPCSPRRRADPAPATTAPSARKAPRSMPRSTPLGHLLALKVTPANEQERAQVGALIKDVQEATGEKVEVSFADQGCTGEEPAEQAARQGVRLVVVKLAAARKGFVLLPKRWVVERSFAWAARFRRLARDYGRWPSSFAGLHGLAFLTLMLNSVSH